jgi:hypothetical protein
MRYVDHNGESGTIAVGTVPSGIGFACVTITYEDVSNPFFLPWFLANIHCRFVNASVVH